MDSRKTGEEVELSRRGELFVVKRGRLSKTWVTGWLGLLSQEEKFCRRKMMRSALERLLGYSAGGVCG